MTSTFAMVLPFNVKRVPYRNNAGAVPNTAPGVTPGRRDGKHLDETAAFMHAFDCRYLLQSPFWADFEFMNLTLEQYEKLVPRCEIEHAGKRMVFFTPNTGTKWRVETILSKEPCTLEWIAGFRPNDIVFDVGANVGMYTIWAAATRGARVYAFEPEAQNYAVLNRNVLFNDLQHLVTAYCMGLSDARGLTDLHMANVSAGDSCHAVGEALDFNHEPLPAIFRQGCITFSLDDLVLTGLAPVPTHIKIDVDGIEPKIIAGARQTLKNPAVRSLLIELNLNLADHTATVAILNEMGFRHDPAQVGRATRTDGPFKGVAEHVFQR